MGLMKYRQLGKTGLMVSEIGLGTAQIGGPSLIGGRFLGSPRIGKSEAIEILNKARDAGINFFDTSDKYGDGNAERLLGEVFNQEKDRVIFATKCGIVEKGNRCFEESYVRLCLEQSLKNLNTDCIDLFQLTKPDMSVIRSGEIYRMLDKYKREGKIRFSGVSTGSEAETMQLIADNQIDTLQIFYNLLHIAPNEGLIQKAFESRLGLIIRSPLSSGVLSGRYNHQTQFSKEDDRSAFLFGQTLTSRVDMVNKIADHFKLTKDYTILHFSLNYLLSNPKISTIIPGTSQAAQLKDILNLCDMRRMALDEFQCIEEFVKTNFHKG